MPSIPAGGGESKSMGEFIGSVTDRETNFVLIGGVARSGTTSLSRLLHSVESVFCFDECPLLKQNLLFDTLCEIAKSFSDERALWEHDGKSYRGLSCQEERQRQRRFVISTIATFTPDTFLENKVAESIRTLACKTPSLELSFLSFAQHFPHETFSYLHCVRDPLKVIASNWEMPWIQSTGKDEFVDSFVYHFVASRNAYLSICSHGTEVTVVRNEDIITSAASCLARISKSIGCDWRIPPDSPNERYDDWPAERRRKCEPLDLDWLRSKLRRNDRMLEWCETFDYNLDG